MIEVVVEVKQTPIQLIVRDDPKWNETRISCQKGARSQDVNWKYVTNKVNPLGRHPFNIITEEVL